MNESGMESETETDVSSRDVESSVDVESAQESASKQSASTETTSFGDNAARSGLLSSGNATFTGAEGNLAVAETIQPALAPEPQAPSGVAPTTAAVGPTPTAFDKDPLGESIKGVGKVAGAIAGADGGTFSHGTIASGLAKNELEAGAQTNTAVGTAMKGVKAASGIAQAPGQIDQLLSGKKADGTDASTLDQVQAAGGLVGTVGDTAGLVGQGIEAATGQKGSVASALGGASKHLGTVGKAAGLAGTPAKFDELVTGKKADGTDASAIDRAKAGLDVAKGVGDAGSLAVQGIEAVGKHVDVRATTEATTKALLDRGMDAKAARQAASAAAKQAVGGGSKSAIKAAAKRAGAGSLGNVAKHAAKTAAGAGKVAKGAKAIGRVAGKAGARFAPGLNVAMAGIDTAAAGKDIYDAFQGKASVGKAVTSGIRAVGSIAAATNIPIVSQVGAGISALADIAQSFWWSK